MSSTSKPRHVRIWNLLLSPTFHQSRLLREEKKRGHDGGSIAAVACSLSPSCSCGGPFEREPHNCAYYLMYERATSWTVRGSPKFGFATPALLRVALCELPCNNRPIASRIPVFSIRQWTLYSFISSWSLLLSWTRYSASLKPNNLTVIKVLAVPKELLMTPSIFWIASRGLNQLSIQERGL